MPHVRVFLRPLASALLLTLLGVASGLAGEATVPQRARALAEAGHGKSARRLLDEQIAKTPDDPATLSAMAWVRADAGEIDEAEKLARRAVQLAPRSPEAHEALARVLGGRAQKAGMLKGLSLVGQFRKEAEAAAALDPQRVEARHMLVQFHLQAPGIAGGDKKKARALAEEIGRIDPVRGDLALAEVAQATKDSQAVEGLYRRAVARDPKNVEARLALAGWLLAPWRLRLDEAETQARAALAEAPDRSGGYALLAIIAVRRKNDARLDSVLAAADEHSPDSRGAWYQAGRLLLADGRDLPRAEKFFRHYLEIAPEPGTPSLAHAHWRLAQVLEKENRRADAIAELDTALRLKPDLDEAKKDRKRLKG